MPSDQFERTLRQRLEGAEMPPSPDLWAAIAEQVGPPPPKRRAAFWWWLDGTALALLVALWVWPVAPTPQGEARSQTASLSELSVDRPIPPSTDSPISDQGRGLESQATSREVRSQTASLSELSVDRSHNESANSRISDQGRGLENQATSREDRSQTASLSELSVDRPHNESNNSPIIKIGPRLTLLTTNWENEAVSQQETNEMATPSPWRIQLGMMGAMSPTANGWVWNSQIHEPDIRANYSRGLGANQVSEEEIHLFRLPNRTIGLQAAVEYQLSPRLSLEGGLNWLRSSVGTYEKGSISGEQPIGPTVRDPFIEVENRYQFRLHQLEVPLLLHAHVYPNGQHWSLSAGVVLGHNQTWQVAEAEGTALATEDRALRNANQANVLSLRPWYGQAVGQIQYYLPLATGGEIYMGPIARYQLSGQYGGLQAAGQSRYLLGLQAGFRLIPK
ncbi:MAG: hypothetical protein AAF399_06565 [Bacteroidota bacterium]